MTSPERADVTIPAAEVLASPEQSATVWPELMAQSHFAAQITEHGNESATVLGAHSTESLYSTLTGVLEDESRLRLALYLPFDVLSRADPRIDEAAALRHFRTAYRAAWFHLLDVHDVAANFVDGDVSEEQVRTGKLLRTVKAAELAPKLALAGMVDDDEVTSIFNSASDAVLRASLAKAYGLPRTALYQEGVNVSERRQLWLEERRQEIRLQLQAKQFARILLESDQVAALPGDSTAVEGLYEAVRSVSSLSDDAGKRLFERYLPSLEALWPSSDVTTHRQLVRTYRRLHSLGIVDKALLAEHNVTLAKLEGPFSANLTHMQVDVEQLSRITNRIEQDETLSELVYPVALIGGSRLKGYGEAESDVDLCVFVKPGTDPNTKSQVEAALQQAFEGYEPIAFWLDQTSEGLAVHDFADPDVHTADSGWTHSLFGSAWVGNRDSIQLLQQQLLPTYFSGTKHQRQRYLERLEQDLLQYRLLQKGYVRHRALEVPSDREVFWDEGYRRLATKLYVSQVWLPKL